MYCVVSLCVDVSYVVAFVFVIKVASKVSFLFRLCRTDLLVFFFETAFGLPSFHPRRCFTALFLVNTEINAASSNSGHPCEAAATTHIVACFVGRFHCVFGACVAAVVATGNAANPKATVGG